MSTRSRIAIQDRQGKYRSVYHHYDGYPEGVGVSLQRYFPTYISACSLIAGGDISGIDWDDGHVNYYAKRSSWDDPRGGHDEPYKDVAPIIDKTFEDLLKTADNSCGCYLYVYYLDSNNVKCYDLRNELGGSNGCTEVSIPSKRREVA